MISTRRSGSQFNRRAALILTTRISTRTINSMKSIISAKFVLLRWDQMNELAFHLNALAAGAGTDFRVDEKLLCEALKRVGDRNLNARGPYIEFFADVSYPRRDYDKYQVWSVSGVDAEEAEPPFSARDRTVWLRLDRDQQPPRELAKYLVEKVGPGEVRCRLKPEGPDQ